jgi:predicted enzyme related to lactoylglutathione lyase
MGERTSYAPGTFSWVELLTPDVDDAKRFYSGLFGWDYEDSPVGEGNFYSMASVGGKYVAGTYSPPPEQGTPPNWLSYVTTDDVDRLAERAGELGATVMAGPFDVLEAGRMAVLQDPTGAVFGTWQARDHIGAQLVNAPGALTLNQLNTSDPEAAQRFYNELFEWRIDAVDTGGGPPYWGIYRADGSLNGGMMTLADDAQAPSHWLAYFVADDLDDAARRIPELGGEVVVPPTPVPGGRFAVARDPQDAYFALFEGRLDP